MRKSAVISAILLLYFCIPSYPQIKYEIPFPRPINDTVDTLSIIIIGDVMMHAAQMEHDHHEFLSRIAPKMKDADWGIANMEFTLAGPPYTGYPQFSCPEYLPDYLAFECGTDIFLTANNHILDYGSEGLLRTLDYYDKVSESSGISYTGSAPDENRLLDSYPLMIEKKGIRIAIINFTYGTNLGQDKEWPKVNRMNKDGVHSAFERAKEKGADFIIVLPHWGTEYSLSHDASQEKWAEWLVDEGADIIIGSHPHVVQDTTHINGVPVIYSLGNAVSNMSVINSRLGLAATVRFVSKGSNGAKKMLEPQLDFIWCTLPGRLTESYATLFIKEWANRKNDWLTPSDYDKMIETWDRVKTATGISD